MTSHLARLLADHYASCGMDREEALAMATATIGTLVAAEAMQPERLEAWERDARIYELRGQGLSASTIGLRVSLSRARVFEAIRRHMTRRRAGLMSPASSVHMPARTAAPVPARVRRRVLSDEERVRRGERPLFGAA